MSDITSDSLFDGKLICHQYKDGYRFSIDAVLLAHYAQSACTGDTVLDLCCGCGIIGLILAYRCENISVIGLELQPNLVGLARTNSLENGFEDRFTVIRGDVKTISYTLKPESVQTVVCNPPYGKQKSGRISHSREAAIARHEIHADLQDCVKAASYAVQNRGRVFFIYPSTRLPVLIQALYSSRLVPKKIQPVYSYPESLHAKLVIVESVKNGGEECTLSVPVYIYQYKNGPYSPEVAVMYARS